MLLAFIVTILLFQVRKDYITSSSKQRESALAQYLVQESNNVFSEIIFTRWRGPALYKLTIQRGGKIEKLSYEDFAKSGKRARRHVALQLSLGRTHEIDYTRDFPPVLKRFDLLIMRGAKAKINWTRADAWASGTICSCFMEVPEPGGAGLLIHLREMLTGMKASATKPCFRFLVLGASDTRLSSPSVKSFIDQIQSTNYFDRIYYEAMDVEIRGVDPMPIGLTDFYVMSIPPRSVENAVRNVDLAKKNGLLAAWGAFWPRLDERLPWRASLIKWVESTPWIERTDVSPTDWYATLASHRFMACPDGHGVVSPKWAEALLVQTIPITPPLVYYKKLKALGYPFVIVNDWNEITEEKLDEWWLELSPLLERSAWMHTSECWWILLSSPLKAKSTIEDVLTKCIPPPV